MKTAIALLVASTSLVGVMAKDFGVSCDNIVVADHTVRADCLSQDDRTVCSVLDLSPCVRNSYGRLESVTEDYPIDATHPSYIDACWDCSNGEDMPGLIISGDTFLHCSCDATNGITIASLIDLNIIVSNINGVLECYGSRAVPCEE